MPYQTDIIYEAAYRSAGFGGLEFINPFVEACLASVLAHIHGDRKERGTVARLYQYMETGF